MMGIVDLGRAFPVSHGDWVSGGGTGTGGAYERLSIVRHLGKTWISAIETTEEPTNGATDWDIMVEDAVFSQPTGFKNYIINGGFDVWQRGTNFNSFGYTADRARSDGDGTGAVSISKQVFSAGDTSVVGAKNYYRFQRTTAGSGSTWTNAYAQLIEGLQRFAGKTLTISFWVKNSINSNINIVIQWIYSTGGSTEGVSYTVPSTTSWTKVSHTFTVPTFSGKTFGENNCIGINITPKYQLNSVYTLEIAQVQLEEGSVATDFENRPYGLELALCQRYFERRRLAVFAPITSSAYGGSVPVNINNTFRVSPSFSVNSVLSSSNWVGSLTCAGSGLGAIVFSSVQQTTAGAYIDTICDFSAELL